MKNLIFATILGALLFNSCATTQKFVAPAAENSVQTDKTVEEVWSKVIDLFAENGIPITTIDKSSGLIVASKTSFKDSYTFSKNDKPIDPDAMVLLPNNLKMSMALSPSQISGDCLCTNKERRKQNIDQH